MWSEFTGARSKVVFCLKYSLSIGCSHTKPTRLISNTPYKLLQFQLLGPGVVCFCLCVLVLLPIVCFYFYIRHERRCHDWIILPLPARRYALFTCIASAAGSLEVAVVLFSLLPYASAPGNGWLYSSFSLRVAYTATTFIGSCCPEVMWRHV